MRNIIAQLQRLGKVRTSETYTAALRSFMSFRNEQDVPVDEISSGLMLLYEAHLKGRGISMNTISFYMRNLRAAYNRAVEKWTDAAEQPLPTCLYRSGQERKTGHLHLFPRDGETRDIIDYP